MKNNKEYLQAVKEVQSLDLKERLIPIPNYPGYFFDPIYGDDGYGVYSTKRGFKKMKGGTHEDGYRTYGLTENGKLKSINRSVIAMMVFKGFVSNGRVEVVDHFDNDPTNDRLENLQVITHRKNITKDRKDGSSKYPGVSLERGQWKATTSINNKEIYLGHYSNELSAAIVYRAALTMHQHGMSVDEIIAFRDIEEVEYIEYNKKNGLTKTGKPKKTKEQINARQKEYYLKNKDKINAKARAKREANKLKKK